MRGLSEYGVIVLRNKSTVRSCGEPPTRRISNCILRVVPVSAQHIAGSLVIITDAGWAISLAARQKLDLIYVFATKTIARGDINSKNAEG